MRKFAIILINCLLVITMAACTSNADKIEPTNNTIKVEETPLDSAGDSGAEAVKPATNQPTAQPDNSEKTIVFSTFYETDFIKTAIKAYEAKHPNIKIELKIAQANGDDANWEANNEKFVKTTNTQMLSGKGPDLLEMDQLPIAQYVNKKVLVNLSEMMETDTSFQRDDYFTNILDNVKLNDGVYGMPVRFYLYGLTGDEAAIKKSGVTFDDSSWTWDQFIQTVKELKQKGDREYAFLARPEYLLNEMVQGNYAAFVDQAKQQGKFDSVAFTDLMKQIKTMFADKVLVEAYDFPDTYFIEDMFSSIRNYILSGTVQNPHTFEERKLYSKPITAGQKPGGFFRSDTTIGINANSPVKAAAWDFLKFLISDEVQPGGFPLNKSAYQKLEQQILQDGSVKADEEGQAHGKVFKVTEADMQRLDAYLASAIHPVEFKPSKLEDIIMEEAPAFFKDQKSAEAVAKLIQNRATLFLNE